MMESFAWEVNSRLEFGEEREKKKLVYKSLLVSQPVYRPVSQSARFYDMYFCLLFSLYLLEYPFV